MSRISKRKTVFFVRLTDLVSSWRNSVAVAPLCVLALAAAAQTAVAEPPKVVDMLLVGQKGAAKSTVSRSVLMVGKYVYVSGEPGLQTIDASDPAHLKLTSDWTESSPKMNGSAVKGQVLYVTNWSPNVGLVLFDLADPAHPRRFKTINTSIHSWEVDVYGDVLYVSVGNETKSAIQTYDIKDPRNPALVATISIDDRLIGNASRFGNHLYFTHKSALLVYDVKNPASPRRVRSLDVNGLCGKTRVRGKYLYMLVRQVREGEQGGVRVYSLADPVDPKPVGFWEQFEARDMCFLGDFLIVPASGSGMFTVDASEPERLKQVAHWGVQWPDTGHGGYAVAVTGAGRHVFVGTTGGNNKGCDDFATCPHYGARLYAVEMAPR